VVLEVTGSAWEIVRILEPYVAEVIVVSPGDTGITQARAKTDRLDARTLAKLLWAGELDGVWRPDERTRVLRRRLAQREQLVGARRRAKNEVHAVLMRQLVGRPPFADLFGVKGRKWLRELELPAEECDTVEACMRHVEFLDSEIAQVERKIAKQTLLIGRAAPADRPRGERDLRRDVPGGDRRYPPVQELAGAGRLPRP
jgi:transposase